MKTTAVAMLIAGLASRGHATGPIGSMRSELRVAEERLAELRSLPVERQDAKAIDSEDSKVVTCRHLLAEMERSIARYREEHDIDRWKLGPRVRSPVVRGEFLGGWLVAVTESGNGYGRPRFSVGLHEAPRADTGIAHVELTMHLSAGDALEEVLIGGALPAPPPRAGIGDVGFSRDPAAEYAFVRDNILVRVDAEVERGYRADEIARRVDAMILASPRAEDPAHPVVTLEPGLESRLMPKVKRTLPIPPSPGAIPSPLLPPPAAPTPSRP